MRTAGSCGHPSSRNTIVRSRRSRKSPNWRAWRATLPTSWRRPSTTFKCREDTSSSTGCTPGWKRNSWPYRCLRCPTNRSRTGTRSSSSSIAWDSCASGWTESAGTPCSVSVTFGCTFSPAPTRKNGKTANAEPRRTNSRTRRSSSPFSRRTCRSNWMPSKRRVNILTGKLSCRTAPAVSLPAENPPN